MLVHISDQYNYKLMEAKYSWMLCDIINAAFKAYFDIKIVENLTHLHKYVIALITEISSNMLNEI